MLGVGSAALVANLICLALLWRFRRENVNMSSTFECSRNDVASNVGVLAAAGLVGLTGSAWPDIIRSEEHTSELQSLMRISYAVFCLKKKKITHTNYSNIHC